MHYLRNAVRRVSNGSEMANCYTISRATASVRFGRASPVHPKNDHGPTEEAAEPRYP